MVNFSWVSKWKWSQGQFLMNKLYLRLTLIFWHINSFIIKGSAEFRNKAKCLLVLSKRFVLSKSIKAGRCRTTIRQQQQQRIKHTQQMSPGVSLSAPSNWKISSKLSRLRIKSNHPRRGADICDVSAVCELVFGSFTSKLRATSTTRVPQSLQKSLKMRWQLHFSGR